MIKSFNERKKEILQECIELRNKVMIFCLVLFIVLLGMPIIYLMFKIPSILFFGVEIFVFFAILILGGISIYLSYLMYEIKEDLAKEVE